MALFVYFLLFMFLTGHSSKYLDLYFFLLLSFSIFLKGANYCLCKDGVGDQLLQKAIDYACGAGADCAPIMQNGPCFQPNTVKDHCNYAVNSYFQRKGQVQGSCDFSGATTPSVTAPPTSTSTCVFPSSPSNAGTSTTTTPTTTTPSTSSSTLKPPTGTTTGSPNVFGISPTSSTGFTDPNHGVVNVMGTNVLLLSLLLTFWLLALRV
ncbi:PREDICTED: PLASMODESMATA CALLOSE-BINDING PROTEIN 3-like isoform X2 [Lupinus angustifolius]|uniref:PLASMODESMATA CALLOSE-BINDING PROTEIN 3-like isoform X2 n=1 Tax=Lupinus angustifolius TaxID=3871 RepID=UPI00092EB225|nr:PREDICTED: PLASMODESMATA CALLOSE-BINDING PROTEIN 3-like isoform X2 [Lupinus angustifolius]